MSELSWGLLYPAQCRHTVTIIGLGLGHNPPHILNIVAERQENYNVLLLCFEFDEKK
ncbi:MAG: hypothetical protein JXA91_05740 [Candidatus Thermoplasmatota archaeon]|nr:hypothetical protein [Candidatus Thermoplasmatota archaeon]